MFGKKKKNKFSNHIDTLIGAKTRISGDINFTGGLRIDGYIKGNVTAEDDGHSTLVLSDAGHIDGKIQVANVIINGTVSGPIIAEKYLELQGNAKVHGNVHCDAIEVQLGASVDGKIICANNQTQTEKSTVPTPTASEQRAKNDETL